MSYKVVLAAILALLNQAIITDGRILVAIIQTILYGISIGLLISRYNEVK